jgi:hypothetical protein
MSLKSGDWKMNLNGTEIKVIFHVDPGNGMVSGSIEGLGSLAGLWDETSRTITFACPSTVIAQVGAAEEVAISQRWYKGFLFSTPRNPAPGQDVVWTLTGFVQVNGIADAAQIGGGNARRNVFGWFAQTTEVG